MVSANPLVMEGQSWYFRISGPVNLMCKSVNAALTQPFMPVVWKVAESVKLEAFAVSGALLQMNSEIIRMNPPPRVRGLKNSRLKFLTPAVICLIDPNEVMRECIPFAVDKALWLAGAKLRECTFRVPPLT